MRLLLPERIDKPCEYRAKETSRDSQLRGCNHYSLVRLARALGLAELALAVVARGTSRSTVDAARLA
jgi:hypothetical protein